ncbi:MAG TPA: DUF5329 family protein [Cyclobacteriaceae bacterium]|nr:DUF5329 family protein [Cyclobacteriaceae bacterium]
MKKFWILFLWIGLSQSIFLFGQTDLEKKKIDFLLHQIEQLKAAKFWRNGISYSPVEAVDYLRMKMNWNDRARPIKSAKDFIERIASKSTISGKPYFIQMADGKRIETKVFLEQKLSEWKE